MKEPIVVIGEVFCNDSPAKRRERMLEIVKKEVAIQLQIQMAIRMAKNRAQA